MKLLAVDSNSVFNRAFYGIKLLTTKDGIYTNAIYGFLSILIKLLDDTKPDAVAFAFDLKEPTFRHKSYTGYKAQRKGMPPELASQMPILKELLTLMGYRIIECPGYEADDILGTLAYFCKENGWDCIIATGDRDSLQLVSGSTSVHLATARFGKPETIIYDEALIKEKYGLTPSQLIDVKAIMGDTSDNIPGVYGIGEKGALSLIARFGSLDGVYDNIGSEEIRPAVRKKLEDSKDMAYLSLDLATIRCNAPIDALPEHCLRGDFDRSETARLLSRLEMFSIIERLGLDASDVSVRPSSGTASFEYSEEVSLRFSPDDTVDILFENGVLAFSCSGKIYVVKDDPVPALVSLMASPCRKRCSDSKELFRLALKNSAASGGICFDSSLAAYLLNPSASSYDLNRLLGEYSLPAPAFTSPVPDEAVRCASFSLLCRTLIGEIEKQGLSQLLYEVEIPLARVLADMEEYGFTIDSSGIRAFGEELENDLSLLQDDIHSLAGEPFNINSPKQLGEILFVKLELPAKKKTKSGYSTSADVLESLRGDHPIIEKILSYRKLAKLKSTYVDGLLGLVGKDGRIHTYFRQTETRTGRISSVEPNLQNIPIRTELGSRLRRYFIAPEGSKLIDADYSQIELRVLAHIANDENMIAAFLNGEDIHTATASQVFSVPPQDVTATMRSRAKAVNFGIVYGIGAFSLSQDIGVSVTEADRYIKSYLDHFTGVKQYMERTVRTASEEGLVRTMMGRIRLLPELSSSNRNIRSFGERVARNAPIQGSAADIIKLAMIRTYNRYQESGMRSRLILQVHDELIVEAPEEEVERASEILRTEMENAVSLLVPLSVDIGIADNWLDAH